MKTILVVCIGNVCRSPMAAVLLRRALPGLMVHSAGLGAMIGAPADPIARTLMAEAGMDISGHRAQQVNTPLMTLANLVLVMDSQQKQELERRYPTSIGKVFCLGEHGAIDIPDPYCQPRASFEEVLRLIERSVDCWVPPIRALGEPNMEQSQ
jgi:protein-tyrosine phosphatase